MLDYVEMREDICRELGRREDGDGEELGATRVRSQGKDGDGEELGATGVWSQGELQ